MVIGFSQGYESGDPPDPRIRGFCTENDRGRGGSTSGRGGPWDVNAGIQRDRGARCSPDESSARRKAGTRRRNHRSASLQNDIRATSRRQNEELPQGSARRAEDAQPATIRRAVLRRRNDFTGIGLRRVKAPDDTGPLLSRLLNGRRRGRRDPRVAGAGGPAAGTGGRGFFLQGKSCLCRGRTLSGDRTAGRLVHRSVRPGQTTSHVHIVAARGLKSTSTEPRNDDRCGNCRNDSQGSRNERPDHFTQPHSNRNEEGAAQIERAAKRAGEVSIEYGRTITSTSRIRYACVEWIASRKSTTGQSRTGLCRQFRQFPEFEGRPRTSAETRDPAPCEFIRMTASLTSTS